MLEEEVKKVEQFLRKNSPTDISKNTTMSQQSADKYHRGISQVENMTVKNFISVLRYANEKSTTKTDKIKV